MDYGRFYLRGESGGAKIFFLALSFYCVFGFSNVSYLLPIFYAQTGFSSKQAGTLTAVFYLSSVITRPFMGKLVPTLGFRRCFLTASVLTIGSSLVIAFAGLNYQAAFISRLCLGVGSSFFQIGLATFQAVSFKENKRGRAFSLIMAGGLAPMMTAVPLADWLLNSGYRQAYILIPLLLCVAAWITTRSIPGLDDAVPGADGDARRGGFGGYAECLRIPALRAAIFSMFFFSVTDAASAFMSSMTESYGLMVSYFLSSNAVVGVCVRLFFSRYLDRFPRWKLSPFVVLVMSAALFAASVSPTRISLIALGLVFGVGMGFGFPLNLALASDYAPARLQPQAVSLTWFLMGLNFALVPLLTGWLGMFFGPVAAFRLIAAFAFTGAAFMLPLWRKLDKLGLTRLPGTSP